MPFQLSNFQTDKHSNFEVHNFDALGRGVLPRCSLKRLFEHDVRFHSTLELQLILNWFRTGISPKAEFPNLCKVAKLQLHKILTGLVSVLVAASILCTTHVSSLRGFSCHSGHIVSVYLLLLRYQRRTSPID